MTVKHSIAIWGNKTSVSLEDSFWSALKFIAQDSQLTLLNLVKKVDAERVDGNLSSALRIFVLQHFRGERPNGLGLPDTGHAGERNSIRNDEGHS
jgi:predicted DNA-binding ribbon-helix-helix protein